MPLYVSCFLLILSLFLPFFFLHAYICTHIQPKEPFLGGQVLLRSSIPFQHVYIAKESVVTEFATLFFDLAFVSTSQSTNSSQGQAPPKEQLQQASHQLIDEFPMRWPLAVLCATRGVSSSALGATRVWCPPLPDERPSECGRQSGRERVRLPRTR